MKRLSFFLLYLLLSLTIFSGSETVNFSEVIIIDIFNPPYYSGRFATYYSIIAYKENGFEIFYYICLVKDSAELYEKNVRILDIEKGKKYFFEYVRCNLDGYTYNNFKIKKDANFLLGYQRINNETQR